MPAAPSCPCQPPVPVGPLVPDVGPVILDVLIIGVGGKPQILLHHLQLRIDLVRLRVERGVDELEVVFDLHGRVPVNRGATALVQAGGIKVDLDFAHQVDMRLSGQLAAAQLADGLIDIGLLLLVVDGHRASDVALLEEGLDQGVVTIAAIDIADDGKLEAGALDDVESEADDGRLYFGV